MQKSRINEELKSLVRSLCEPLDPEPTGVQPRLRVLEKVRAVVFDVYGTLLVSASGEVGTEVSEKKPADAFLKALEVAKLGELS